MKFLINNNYDIERVSSIYITREWHFPLHNFTFRRYFYIQWENTTSITGLRGLTIKGSDSDGFTIYYSLILHRFDTPPLFHRGAVTTVSYPRDYIDFFAGLWGFRKRSRSRAGLASRRYRHWARFKALWLKRSKIKKKLSDDVVLCPRLESALMVFERNFRIVVFFYLEGNAWNCWAMRC